MLKFSEIKEGQTFFVYKMSSIVLLFKCSCPPFEKNYLITLSAENSEVVEIRLQVEWLINNHYK